MGLENRNLDFRHSIPEGPFAKINAQISLGRVGCVGIIGNFLLGDLWGLSGFTYTAYTTYTIILLL
jgi:hypothetical protein